MVKHTKQHKSLFSFHIIRKDEAYKIIFMNEYYNLGALSGNPMSPNVLSSLAPSPARSYLYKQRTVGHIINVLKMTECNKQRFCV